VLSWIDTVFSDLLNMNLTKKNANVNMFNKWNLTQKNGNAFFTLDEMETQNNIIIFYNPQSLNMLYNYLLWKKGRNPLIIDLE